MQNRRKGRRGARTDALLALLMPCVGLACFPVYYLPGCVVGWFGLLYANTLHVGLTAMVPHDACAIFPEACGEEGWRSAPRFFGGADLRLLVFDAAVDLLTFTIGMSAACLLATILTSSRLARAMAPPALSLWTLLVTLLLVLGCIEFWTRSLSLLASR